jgi:tetratricopeptide (TPR) repeat protein
MIKLSMGTFRIACIVAAFSVFLSAQVNAQNGPNKPAVIDGQVRDLQGLPLASVKISLEGIDPSQKVFATSDPQGQFHLANVREGSYTLRAKLAGYGDCAEGPLTLADLHAKPVVLVLTKGQTASCGKDSAAASPFSDEPAFTVGGVTDTTELGGHGSGPVMRNSNTLSKETASLARGTESSNGTTTSSGVHADPKEEAAIRARLAKEDNADLRLRLADIEEVEGHPLEAVQDYQRVAELQPTETHLFAWGAELLLHHAPEPAIEVFSKGHRLFPQSGRMMLGLGAAWYAQRSTDQAGQIFMQASDLNPDDPTPYLFLGRLLPTEQFVPASWAERMKRFVSLHPENAMAHYLHAVTLMKQADSQQQNKEAESELKTAIKLDPHLGDAYLQLGILHYSRDDYPGAIAEFQKAIENTAVPDDAHYRLAQVYRRTGETEKARKEIEAFKQLSEQKNQEAERERHEIPQFVYTLRNQNSAAPAESTNPH